MKRRWFLAGLTLSAISASCNTATDNAAEGNEVSAEGEGSQASAQLRRDDKTLVVATTANYPPYEFRQSEGDEDAEGDEAQSLVGFDIDLAKLIAQRLERQIEFVELEFEALIPALMNNEVDMAIAALGPDRNRKQQVDFSNIYYRSRQALVSVDGYLQPRDLSYQTIGIRAGSVQARYAHRIGSEYPNLEIVPYDSMDEMFAALESGSVNGLFVEANIADDALRPYPDFKAQIMPSDQPSGSAIALPKGSSLRREINTILAEIKANGEMDQFIKKWFS